MGRGYFVTGTGTGVGKTFVTAMLARQAVAAGYRVFAFKPIETGCRMLDDRRVGEDQELIAKAAGDWQQGDLRNLYCFERPLAPYVASRHEHQEVDLFHVKQVFQRGAAETVLWLVEGAGGWRVPITAVADMGTLAKQLGLPVIVVGSAGLGTINHTLLTIEAVRRDGCEVALVVLSRLPDEGLASAASNASEIARMGSCPVLTTDNLDVRLLP